jgi:hypothetical protein
VVGAANGANGCEAALALPRAPEAGRYYLTPRLLTDRPASTANPHLPKDEIVVADHGTFSASFTLYRTTGAPQRDVSIRAPSGVQPSAS